MALKEGDRVRLTGKNWGKARYMSADIKSIGDDQYQLQLADGSTHYVAIGAEDYDIEAVHYYRKGDWVRLTGQAWRTTGMRMKSVQVTQSGFVDEAQVQTDWGRYYITDLWSVTPTDSLDGETDIDFTVCWTVQGAEAAVILKKQLQIIAEQFGGDPSMITVRPA